MRTLRIPRIAAGREAPFGQIDAALGARGARLSLDELSWPEFPYRPEVSVVVGHTGDALCLKYSVAERAVLAEKRETNSQVSDDSCVELFIGPADDGLYYNFEWNCIGTCLAAVGASRDDRTPLGTNRVERIRRRSSLGSEPFSERRGEIAWSLIVALPADVLVLHDLTGFAGLQATGNFYKCGDHLTVPHYLAWQGIRAAAPDFHRPEQFGALLFEP